MKSSVLYQGKHHKWVVFGRDEEKSEKIIDTNQYMISTNQQTMLLDPGGVELFPAMLAGILSHTALEQVTTLFASHRDPDIISSLACGIYRKLNCIRLDYGKGLSATLV